jgi:hypothetical protein
LLFFGSKFYQNTVCPCIFVRLVMFVTCNVTGYTRGAAGSAGGGGVPGGAVSSVSSAVMKAEDGPAGKR